MTKIPRVPGGLDPSGKRFWKKVLSEYEITEAHDKERLGLACKCLDEISSCEKIVIREGQFFLDRFSQSKEHPASKAIRDNKVLFCRIIRELCLDLVIPDARPPRQH